MGESLYFGIQDYSAEDAEQSISRRNELLIRRIISPCDHCDALVKYNSYSTRVVFGSLQH